jgi:methyl-accepting chemotaxis protein
MAIEIMEKIARASSEQPSDIDQSNRLIFALESGTVTNSSVAQELTTTLRLITHTNSTMFA